MKLSAFAALGILAASSSAFAQSYTGRVAEKASTNVGSPGYQVGEGTVIHPSVGARTGYVSNVFFQEDTGRAAGVFNVVGQVALTPMNQGEDKDVDFSLGVRMQYAEFLSGNQAVQKQRNLGIGVDGKISANGTGNWPVFAEEHFLRINRPTNFESNSTLSRDINNFKAGIRYAPQGRNLSGRFTFSNTIDVFENKSSRFSNRNLNNLQLGVDWQFLPITRFYLEGSYGFNGGIGASQKVSSQPIRAVTGVDTALTESLTAGAHFGYALGRYSAGSSFSSFLYGGDLGYRYSPVGRVRLFFHREFQDSLSANFYGEYALGFGVDQQISRVMLTSKLTGRLRNYQGINTDLVSGPPNRDDAVVSFNLRAAYEIKEWLSANATYDFATVSTDYRVQDGAALDDPSYTRHQVMAGIDAAL